MLHSSTIDLSRHRIEMAEETLRDAELLLLNDSYSGSTNRSYYSVFNSMRALLSLEKVDYKKHSAVIGHFQRTYIKTGVFSKELSAIVKKASFIRTVSDYQDFYLVSREEAEAQVANAKVFLKAIRAYLEPLWKEAAD